MSFTRFLNIEGEQEFTLLSFNVSSVLSDINFHVDFTSYANFVCDVQFQLLPECDFYHKSKLIFIDAQQMFCVDVLFVWEIKCMEINLKF